MLGKSIAVIVVAATLAGCETTSNEPTDAYVKRTLENNATTMAPRVSASADVNTTAAPNS